MFTMSTAETTQSPAPHQRIIGFDLARAFAILGMVLVNFKIVVAGPQAAKDVWQWTVGLLEGRAAATFVILAGVGISLMARRSLQNQDEAGLKKIRVNLSKRAFLLLVIGLAYTPIWPADILHFYGVYIFLASFLITGSSRKLILATALAPLVFLVLLFTLDYETAWNWETLAYADMWTFNGMIRHLFFNGFHPVFPWVSFVFWGMWLGRQPLQNSSTRLKIGAISLGIGILVQGCSSLATYFASNSLQGEELEAAVALLGTAPMPPMPWYLLAAGGFATAFICLCIEFTQRFPKMWGLKGMVLTGQLALTHYVAHVLVGMGCLEALGFLENGNARIAVIASLVFFASAYLFSVVWRRFFSRGPLEWVLRKLAG